MKKKIAIILIIVVLAALAVLIWYRYSLNSQGKKTESNFNKLISQIEGIVAKPSVLDQDIEVSGSVAAFEETNLIPEISGKVIKINFEEGKAVAQGVLLVKIFDEDLQAQLKMVETQLKIAENTEKRMKALLAVNGTSQQEYDASYLQINNLKAQIEIIKVNISKTEIRAPYAGVIGLKKISPGQYITPANVIASIRAISTLKLDFSIPEKYSSEIENGTRVSLQVTGNDHIYEAKVIARESQIESESRNLNVRALISGDIKGLVPGAFAKVKVNLATKPNAIMIPTSSIIPVSDQKKVFISRNGIAEQVTIKTGVRKASDVEVISGINPGDTLVVTGVLFIKQGSPLKFAVVK